MACTSTNLLYYYVTGDDFIYEIQYDDSTGSFGTYSHPKPAPPVNASVRKIKVDDDDNPIVFFAVPGTNRFFMSDGNALRLLLVSLPSDW